MLPSLPVLALFGGFDKPNQACAQSGLEVSLTSTDFNFGTSVEFSISYWARFATIPDTGEANDPVFLSNKDGESGNNVGWVIATGPDGRLLWNYRAAGQDRRDYDGPAGTLNNTNWNHVAVNFARSGNIVTYLNGRQVNARSAGPLANMDAGLRTNIGNDGRGNYALGLWDELFVDDVAIWQRAVTPAEVSAIYTAGQNGASAIPEPSSMFLAGLGLAMLLGYGWRQCRRDAPAGVAGVPGRADAPFSPGPGVPGQAGLELPLPLRLGT
jgi:hypothetical protein